MKWISTSNDCYIVNVVFEKERHTEREREGETEF